jgi:hypothetical protein
LGKRAMVYWASILISCILGMATPIPAGSKIEGGCGGWRGATARGAVFIYSFIQGGGGAKARERERESQRDEVFIHWFIRVSDVVNRDRFS